ncbi:MAG TPA: LTA synthase family protein, partial [Desulforhopalus sp.]|nr:LTA synthase family protein [Desulforhopalus sp.]
SSWGTMMVLAPGDARLPRLKKGSYGLVDVEASVLDYLRQPLPEKIIGRSFFRDYARPREMVSYTSGKLRWQTAENRLFECSVDGSCMVFSPSTLLAPNRDAAVSGTSEEAARIFGLAELLDQRISADMGEQRLQFGKGAIRELPAKIRNEWVDNLVGAQYLDFPAGSTVAVDIRVNAVATNPDGIQLRLVMRQFEQEVDEIAHPPFPRLLQGEAGSVQFHFTNQEPRQAFSFHLVGEGAGNVIEIEKFEVAIAPR